MCRRGKANHHVALLGARLLTPSFSLFFLALWSVFDAAAPPPAMASLGRISGSVISGVNENTLALANLNFDFSLLKIEAPREYSGGGTALAPIRRDNAESGGMHRTARKLGALFEAVIPQAPKLVAAYGSRASEIAQMPGANPAGKNEHHGPFSAFVGADATSIWAAATSGHVSIAMHLLACLLARGFSDPGQSTSVWAELVLERQREIQRSTQDGPMLNMAQFAAASAASQPIARSELQQWDASARAWLRTADSAMQRNHIQLKLIRQNVSLPVSTGGELYVNVIRSWTQAMLGLERLLHGQPQSVTDGGIILAISAWHLYPNLLVLDAEIKKVDFSDSEIPSTAVLTVGITNTPDLHANVDVPNPTEGIYWSVSLSHYRFYGRPVETAGEIDDRVSIDDLYLIALGSLLGIWKAPRFDEASLQWFVALWDCVKKARPYLPDIDWLEHLALGAKRVLDATGQMRRELFNLVDFGQRRGQSFLIPPQQQQRCIPWFGLRCQHMFDSLSGESPQECGVRYLRQAASAMDLRYDEALITQISIQDRGGTKAEFHQYTSALPIPAFQTTSQVSSDGGSTDEEVPDLHAAVAGLYTASATAGVRHRSYPVAMAGSRGALPSKAATTAVSAITATGRLHVSSSELGTRSFQGHPSEHTPSAKAKFSSRPRRSPFPGNPSGNYVRRGSRATPGPKPSTDPPYHQSWEGYSSTYGTSGKGDETPTPQVQQTVVSEKQMLRYLLQWKSITANENSPVENCSAYIPEDLGIFPGRPVHFTKVLGDSTGSLRLWITKPAVQNRGNIEPGYKSMQQGKSQSLVDIHRATEALASGKINSYVLWQYLEGSDPDEPDTFIIPFLELVNSERARNRELIASLRSLAVAKTIYSTLDGATISLGVVTMGIYRAKWARMYHLEWRLTRSIVFSCIAMFETGKINIEGKRLEEVLGLSSGNSLFVVSRLLGDPSSQHPHYAVTRITGNVGKAGVSLLIPPVTGPLVRPLSESIRATKYAVFDGNRDDKFKGTSFHLTFTSHEFPLDYGVMGIHDHQVFFVESVISVHDAGQWVADLDVSKVLNWNLEQLRLPMGRRPCKFHSEEARAAVLDKFTAVDTWEEVLDTPPGIGIVRASENWSARLATSAVLTQPREFGDDYGHDGYKQHRLNFMILEDGPDCCWACVYRRVRKRVESGDEALTYIII
jgi:hypothetical protein